MIPLRACLDDVDFPLIEIFEDNVMTTGANAKALAIGKTHDDGAMMSSWLPRNGENHVVKHEESSKKLQMMETSAGPASHVWFLMVAHASPWRRRRAHRPPCE